MTRLNISYLINKNKWLIVSVSLWIIIWAGYNTGIERILAPGFPASTIDLIHGLRSFLPILAGLLAFSFLFVKRKNILKGFLLKPLGLLLLFSILGIFSSLIFSTEPLRALYWGLMYISVLLVLLAIMNGANGLKNLCHIIRINWIIAAILALGLLVFFLIQFNVFENFSFNSLICSGRPYEKLAGIKAETDIFGMAGTRPTGFGRYAGIAALVFFVFLISRQGIISKVVWGILFFLFLLINFFARGKAVLASFSGSLAFTLFILKEIRIYWILLLIIVILASGFLILYKEPCSFFINGQLLELRESNGTASYSLQEKSYEDGSMQQITGEKQLLINSKELKKIATLTGRTTGVWNDSINLFFSSPVLGYGFQSDRIFLNGQHAHNSIIHALIQTGLLGSIPFVLAFALTIISLFYLFKNSLLDKKEKIFLIEISAVFVFILIRSITESFTYYSADFLFLAPIIAYIELLREEKNFSNKHE